MNSKGSKRLVLWPADSGLGWARSQQCVLPCPALRSPPRLPVLPECSLNSTCPCEVGPQGTNCSCQEAFSGQR
jgi:hypothetical protein